MRINTGIIAALLSLAMAPVASEAASLAEARVPAELPPATYEGAQYIDSRGCVYSRAQVDGEVKWVPRVNQGREVVCGFEPTISKPAPAPEPVAEAPKPKATAAATPVKAPAKAPVKSASLPKSNVFIEPEPAPPQSRRQVRRAARNTVRTGGSLRAEGTIATSAVPRGFELAWDDDRLNPKRGIGTDAGDEQMALVWTDEVPRRLVISDTGQDVTRLFPQISYPDWGYLSQPKGDRTISSKSRVRVMRAAAPPEFAQASRPQTAVSAASKNVMPARFVQVGVYREPMNAHRVIGRLVALGLPVRTGNYIRQGAPLHMVLAGPFSNENNLNKALIAARRAGFRDAFVR